MTHSHGDWRKTPGGHQHTLPTYAGYITQSYSLAHIIATQNGVTYGGVICKFNLNGELNKAYCYTKLIDNRIIDEFMLESKFSDPDAVRLINSEVND